MFTGKKRGTMTILIAIKYNINKYMNYYSIASSAVYALQLCSQQQRSLLGPPPQCFRKTPIQTNDSVDSIKYSEDEDYLHEYYFHPFTFMSLVPV